MDFRLVAIHLPHASYAYKSYRLCDRCNSDFMLKAAAVNDIKSSRHLIKLVIVIYDLIQQRISLQRYHRLTMLLIFWLIKTLSYSKMV